MISNTFFTGPANVVVFFLIIGCFICIGAAIGVKLDPHRARWKLVAYMIAAAILAVIILITILFHLVL